jgi:hypothetical protein
MIPARPGQPPVAAAGNPQLTSLLTARAGKSFTPPTIMSPSGRLTRDGRLVLGRQVVVVFTLAMFGRARLRSGWRAMALVV